MSRYISRRATVHCFANVLILRSQRSFWRANGHAQRSDQLGDSLWPVVVSWRACVPSASMDQICRVPVRVDSKTMWRPSGAQLGRSLRPAVARDFDNLASGDVHDVDVVITGGPSPAEGEKLAVG